MDSVIGATFRDADGSHMNVFLLLAFEALVGVGVLVIIYAALSLGLRLAGIRSFHQSIIARGSASGLRAVGIFLVVVLRRYGTTTAQFAARSCTRAV